MKHQTKIKFKDTLTIYRHQFRYMFTQNVNNIHYRKLHHSTVYIKNSQVSDISRTAYPILINEISNLYSIFFPNFIMGTISFHFIENDVVGYKIQRVLHLNLTAQLIIDIVHLIPSLKFSNTQ